MYCVHLQKKNKYIGTKEIKNGQPIGEKNSIKNALNSAIDVERPPIKAFLERKI